VDTRTFEQRATAEARYAIRWPEVSVSTRSTLDVSIGADSYDAVIKLEVCEGDDLLTERRWQRRIPRLP